MHGRAQGATFGFIACRCLPHACTCETCRHMRVRKRACTYRRRACACAHVPPPRMHVEVCACISKHVRKSSRLLACKQGAAPCSHASEVRRNVRRMQEGVLLSSPHASEVQRSMRRILLRTSRRCRRRREAPPAYRRPRLGFGFGVRLGFGLVVVVVGGGFRHV